jgi:hypothetical protein
MKKLLYVPMSVLTLTGLFSNTSVFADSMDLNSIGSSPLENVQVNFNGQSETLPTGAITGSLNGNNTYFFCYDLNHDIGVPNSYTATAFSPSYSGFPSNLLLSGTFNLQVAASMINNVFPSISTTNIDQYAGLQVAIWTVLYDWSQGNTPGLNTSNCSTGFCVPGLSSSIASYANADLAQAGLFAANFPSGQNFGNWYVFTSTNNGNVNQTLIGLGAPEPQTYMILGSLLATTLCRSQLRKIRQTL